ncbi:MAG: OmpA family protein [Saprospiraceae bacterium]|nr:OmpA family protein [Saprospiraceae bacterium]
MSVNFLDLIKTQLTGGSTLDLISGFLGESSTATKSGLGAALPAILGSVVKAGATPEGAGNLLNLIKNGGHDGSALGNIAGLLGGGKATDSFLSGGSSLITTLLGNNAGTIANLIGGLSGMKGSSVSSMLSMAAPLIMSMIGKHTNASGMGASALSSLLSSQSSAINAALPASLSNVLGFANSANDVKKVVKTVEDTTTGGFNFLPWLLGAAGLLAAFYFWKSCSAPKIETPAVIEKAVESTQNAAAGAVAAVAELFKVTLPGGVNLEAPKGSLEDKLVTFVQSTDTVSKTLWFNFDRLLFETGKATLKAESQAQLANVAAILKAFPAVAVKVGGYTDNVGNAAANMKLSADRAKSVAGELVKLGIAAARLVPEGYGDQHPVASNDTEEGRAQNRRIALRVTAK